MKKNGYITLISVLIVGAIATVVAVTYLMLGYGSMQSGQVITQSKQAEFFADACVEEALQQIRDSVPFTGTGSLSFSEGECNYEVVNLGGKNRQINATGIIENVVRKVKVSVDAISPAINLSDWREVGDF